MRYHVITLVVLLGAVACYFLGWGEGIVPLVVVGLVLEGTFWIRLVRGFRRGRERRSAH